MVIFKVLITGILFNSLSLSLSITRLCLECLATCHDVCRDHVVETQECVPVVVSAQCTVVMKTAGSSIYFLFKKIYVVHTSIFISFALQ